MKFKVGDNVVISRKIRIRDKRYVGLTGKVVELLVGERHAVDEAGNVYPYLVEVDKRHAEFKRWYETIYCREGEIVSNNILATKWIKRHEV